MANTTKTAKLDSYAIVPDSGMASWSDDSSEGTLQLDTTLLDGWDSDVLLLRFDFTMLLLGFDRSTPITGIELTFDHDSNGSSDVQDKEIGIAEPGGSDAVEGSDNKAEVSGWGSGGREEATYGGSTDDWSAGLTVGDLRGHLLAFRIQPQSVDGTQVASIESADTDVKPTVTITFDDAPAPPNTFHHDQRTLKPGFI